MIPANKLPDILNKINRLMQDIPQKLYISHKLKQMPAGEERSFKILVSAIISLRTKEKVTWEVSEKLYGTITNVRDLNTISEAALSRLLYPCGFYRQKSGQLKDIAYRLITEFNGKVPDTMDALLSLNGVGRKVANLVLTEAFDKEGLCVDTHVHRIANRWEWVNTRTPDATEIALRELLPTSFWKTINAPLVLFGQNCCKPVNPKCSECFLSLQCPSSTCKEL